MVTKRRRLPTTVGQGGPAVPPTLPPSDGHGRPGTPEIITLSLPNGEVGVAYSQTIQVSRGYRPVTFARILGNLPSGLSLNTNTGVISGTPTMAQTTNFTIAVYEPNDNLADNENYTVTITGGGA